MRQILLTFLLFLSIQSHSQWLEDLKFKHISLEEGLSNGLVQCVIQDKKGYIWIGTDDGLNRYNGHDFVVYRHDPAISGSIVSNAIRDLLEDRKGRLWVATEGGLEMYDRTLDRFVHFKGEKNTTVQTVYEDRHGTLWVGTTRGLAILSETTNELEYFNIVINNLQFVKPFSDLNFSVNVILEAGDDNIIIGTGNGLLILDRETQKFEWLKNVENDENSLPGNPITSMVVDSPNRLWISTDGGGMGTLDLTNRKFEPFSLKDKKILSLFIDDHRSLWVGTQQSGLLRILLDSVQNPGYHYDRYKAMESQGSLSYRTVTTFFQDQEKNMWIGTYGDGINFVSAHPRFFNTIQRIPSLVNTLTHKKVWGLCEDADGNIWIGTDGGGVNFYDVKAKSLSYYDHTPADQNSISDHAILSAARDLNGRLWFGTYAGGLNRFDPKNQTFKRYQHSKTDTSSLGSNDVRVIFPDSKGNLWLGTNQGGLNLFDNESGHFRRYTTANSKISGNDIRSIYEDKKGRLWIGTYQNGFNQFYNGKFANFWIDGLENAASNYNTIFSICEDSVGNIWLGTYGSGLVKFSPDSKKIKIYTEKHGLANNTVHAIVPDSHGNFWITTNNGISRFNLKKERFKNFDTNDGLPGSVFNNGSWLKSSSGTIYFGSLNGLVYFDPSSMYNSSLDPPDVALEGLRIFNKEIKPTDDKNVILYSEFHKNGQISLNYQQSVFTIDYTALGFARPRKVQYAYRLAGIEKDWNYVGAQVSATYTTLPPGEYIFSVMASYDGLNWTSPPRNLKIAISPAPWKTWWAYTLYMLVIAVALYASRKYKLNKVALQNRLEMERMERQKLSEVYDLKFKFFTNVSHEFRTPLTLVIDPLRDLIHKGNFHPAILKKLTFIYNHAHRLLNLVNQLMEFRKAESGHLQLKATENNIVSFAQTIYDSFSEAARIDKIEFTFESKEDEILLWFDRNHFEIILYNLISNAFKYTPRKGKIDITIKKVADNNLSAGDFMPGYCEIQVADSGKGIAPEHMDQIFDRYYQVIESDTVDVMGTGIGLALVKDLVDLHNGSVSVSSQKGISTKITLRFPLGKSHFNDGQLDFAPDEFVHRIHYNPPAQIEKASDIQKGSENKNIATLLLVEDNHDIRAYIKSIFQDNYLILEADNGKNGFELAVKEAPDAIVSDIMMPEMDGIDFCRQLKDTIDTSHIPVLFLTAKTSDQHKIEGISMGADDYLTKPFNAELLKAKVSRLIENRARLKEYYSKNITLQPSNIDVTPEDETFLKNAMLAVEDNLSNEAFGVKELMDALCMSQPTLYRKIKMLTDESPSEFIRSIRLKAAAQLLRQGQSSIAQVSYDVGFNSVRYFRDCFKNQFGKTPSDYLKEQKITA
ncbi:two-component regulator propeller domain-containing protein [Fulvivirgaceae bacterium BMA12]|uniref:histidine kinase n=1 Tax=Agaribacillus aureus TaxID=3051825 RepID=A0ABT8LHH2_9BACT|nr:two-component regulator propeller domain-containing protein [Fulvivirgaceae bacterium BMA12]